MKQQQKKAAKHVGWKTKWYIQYLFFECFVVYGWRKAGKKNTSKSVQLSLKDRCFQPAFPKQSPNIFPRKGLTMKLQWMVSEGTLKTEVLKQRSAKKKGVPKTLSRKNETRQWLDDVGRSFFFGGENDSFWRSHRLLKLPELTKKAAAYRKYWAFLRQQRAGKKRLFAVKEDTIMRNESRDNMQGHCPKNKRLNCDTFNKKTHEFHQKLSQTSDGIRYIKKHWVTFIFHFCSRLNS